MQENSVSIIKLYRRYYQCDIYITHIRMLLFFFSLKKYFMKVDENTLVEKT